MEVSDFIQAIVEKLNGLFPGTLVYVDRIPEGATGNCLVRCIKQSHTKKLDRRRERSYQFEILYYQTEEDSLAYYDWAERLYREMEMLRVEEHIFHMKNLHAENSGDKVLHFLFDVSFSGLLAPRQEEPMEALRQQNEVK